MHRACPIKAEGFSKQEPVAPIVSIDQSGGESSCQVSSTRRRTFDHTETSRDLWFQPDLPPLPLPSSLSLFNILSPPPSL